MVAKELRSFRERSEVWQALETYSKKWKCTPVDALERLLLRWRYLDDVGFSEFQETLDEEISCSLRIRNKGLFFCMHGVPNNVKLDRRLIETLDICRVCRRRKIGLTEASLLKAEVAGQGYEDQKPQIGSATPSPFTPSISPPDPIKKPAPVSSIGFSCPIFKNRSYCIANPCEHRKQCRKVGRIPHG